MQKSWFILDFIKSSWQRSCLSSFRGLDLRAIAMNGCLRVQEEIRESEEAREPVIMGVLCCELSHLSRGVLIRHASVTRSWMGCIRMAYIMELLLQMEIALL